MPADPPSGPRDPSHPRPEAHSLFPPDDQERRRLIGNFFEEPAAPLTSRPSQAPSEPASAEPPAAPPEPRRPARFADAAPAGAADAGEPLARTPQTANVVLHLANGMAYGQISSPHWRLSDALNAEDLEHITLRAGMLAAGLLGEKGAGWPDEGRLSTGEMLVRREAVMLAAPAGAAPWTARPGFGERLWVQKNETPLVVDAGPYRVYGWAHLALGQPLAELLSPRHGRFLPVTNARVRRHPSLGPAGHLEQGALLEVVLINRAHLQVLAVVPQPPVSPLAEPAVTASPTDEQMAVLAQRCAVFQRESRAMTSRLLTTLTQHGLLEGRWFAPGGVIIRQGDPGNTLYVVTAGEVVVEQWHPSDGLREIARLGVGEVFGEGAVVREGRRSATVRTLRGTQVAAIHREGVRWMMESSPAVTAALEELLAHRQASGG